MHSEPDDARKRHLAPISLSRNHRGNNA